MYEDICLQAENAVKEFLNSEHFIENSLLVIGCSSSEIMGVNIGKGSAPEAAQEVVKTILPIIKEKNCLLVAQCCEHLNRALVVERETAEKFDYDIVCVRPVPKAGGSFATAVYESFEDPVLVEHVKARMGMDIGNTMIGMHMKDVVVPVRLQNNRIGEAYVSAAYSRPKLIGGIRAHYPEK